MSTTDKEPHRYEDTDIPTFDDNPRVYVCLGGSFGLITRMFAQAGFRKATSIEDADLIVYGGGSDVSPSLYGQEAIDKCGYPDEARDKLEESIFHRAKELGIPQVGICRGAQFLHVMCGGILWQHVNNHTKLHDMYDITADQIVRTSSTHHQMMQFNDDMTLIALCDEDIATYYEDQHEKIDNENTDDVQPQIEVEVCSYEDQKVLCIQGHPEYGPLEFTSWALHLIRDWFAVNKKETD